MGCFAGCFGLSSNKKRRNSIRKILPRDQRICSYEPLLSSDPTHLDYPQEKISTSNLRFEVDEEEEKKKETKKTKKRVRFNLNVQTYEPILQTFEDNEEAVVIDKKPEDSVYPSNYRYQNCVDAFEEEDETGYGESDLDDEDYYTDEDNEYEDDDEDEEDQFVTPLLNHPVENLAQWKAVKAKPVRVKQVMKENVQADSSTDYDQEKSLLKEIIVNTSLSNWVVPKRCPIVDITNVEKK